MKDEQMEAERKGNEKRKKSLSQSCTNIEKKAEFNRKAQNE